MGVTSRAVSEGTRSTVVGVVANECRKLVSKSHVAPRKF